MQSNSWHHKLSHFHVSFWKEEEKLQKFDYLKKEKGFSKKHFS